MLGQKVKKDIAQQRQKIREMFMYFIWVEIVPILFMSQTRNT